MALSPDGTTSAPKTNSTLLYCPGEFARTGYGTINLDALYQYLTTAPCY